MIDTTFDFRSDARGGDPDTTSPTLRKYHQYLWSKVLPNGKMFNLETIPGKGYLYHNSELGEFVLTSDTALPNYTEHKRYLAIVNQLPKHEIEYFDFIVYTIGGMMVFPGNKVVGGMTINQAKGCNHRIADRMDLALECIRRFYLGEDSPLFDDLARYHRFFSLFNDFKGYVDFFLLQDLVSDDYEAVQYFTPTIDFSKSGRPDSVDGYRSFKAKTIEFVENRNVRIALLNNKETGQTSEFRLR